MSRNGSGTYSLPSGNPVVTGTTISSTTHNTTMSDIANALTTSIASDGQTTPTANLPMGGYKHTGVANGSSRTDYASLGQVQDSTAQLATVTGTDTIVATSSPAVVAYASGQTFRFVSAGANTGAATFNMNSLGAKSITKFGTAALVAGDIPSGSMVTVVYDGTQFQITHIAPYSIQHQTVTRFTAGGTADAITGTLAPAIGSYVSGLRVTTTPGGANTVTGPTLNLNGLGVKTIKKRSSTGSKVALVAGDYNASGPFNLEYDGTDFILLDPVPASSSSSVQIQPISASVGSNALTISASALSLDFRSTTLGSGTVTTVSGTPSNLVISSGSTLGTINATQSRIIVLALNNAGTIELAAANAAGGMSFDETGLISTTAEGGAGAADSANVIYSTTARTNVAYRVIGYIESTQATAGTWATAPSTIQGAGGQSLQRVNSICNGISVATTSGTAIDFTSIPSWVKKITVIFNGVSTNGTSNLQLQIGAGSVDTTGYTSVIGYAATAATSSTGMILTGQVLAAGSKNGHAVLTRIDSTTWIYSSALAHSDTTYVTGVAGGTKTLSGTLDRIRVTTVAGTDTFDAGSINILFE